MLSLFMFHGRLLVLEHRGEPSEAQALKTSEAVWETERGVRDQGPNACTAPLFLDIEA